MKHLKRRSFLKLAGAIPLFYTLGFVRKDKNPDVFIPESDLDLAASPSQQTAFEITNNLNFKPGYLSIVQGPTSDTETLINIFVPRLKKYTYIVESELGVNSQVEMYQTVLGPGHFNIDKLKISNLNLGVIYTLKIIDRKTVIDSRQFKALDVNKANPQFALLSCMADDYRFNDVIDPMWNQVKKQMPDFLIMSGDSVYVDSFEFVERKKATVFDVWQRFIDAFRRIPLYHWQELVPIFATWDDHDYGTNDGDREFISKQVAIDLFQAIFSGKDLPGVWEQGPYGVSSKLSAFGQNIYLMDDRTFRQPNKEQTVSEPYGHWGEEQHMWLMTHLKRDNKPSWIINGNQCFNGTDLAFKETYEGNSSAEFTNFLNGLKNIKAPVVFGSGDVHLSEVMKIPAERIGYDTYEFTSSALHSYTGEGWENPMRVAGAYCKEFNFLFIRSEAKKNAFKIDVKCLGLAKQPYFQKSFIVKSN